MSKWFGTGFFSGGGVAGGLFFLQKHKRNHPRMGSDPHLGRGKDEGGGVTPIPLSGTPSCPPGQAADWFITHSKHSYNPPYCTHAQHTHTHTHCPCPPVLPVCLYDHHAPVKPHVQIPSVLKPQPCIASHSLHLLGYGGGHKVVT